MVWLREFEVFEVLLRFFRTGRSTGIGLELLAKIVVVLAETFWVWVWFFEFSFVLIAFIFYSTL